MKKLIVIIAAGLFLGACAQKTCPTYASIDLNEEQAENQTERTI